MKKKLFSLLIVLVMTVVASATLIACVGNKDTGVGIFLNGSGDAFRSNTANGIKRYYKDKGVTNTLFDADMNQDTQNNQVENAFNNAMTGMAIVAQDNTAIASILTKAKNANLPTVVFSSEPENYTDLEKYNKAVMVTTMSKDAGVIDATILEREFFGVSEVDKVDGQTITKDTITTAWVESAVASNKLVNKVAQYAKTGDTISVDGVAVSVLRTLLVDGDINNPGSYDRTRTALTAVNLFYNEIAKAASNSGDDAVKSMFPIIPLKLENNSATNKPALNLSGKGYYSKFMKNEDPSTWYQYSYSGVLQYHQTRWSGGVAGNDAWGDVGSEADMNSYLNQGDNKVPDVLIGASDQVTSGAVRALISKGYNIAKGQSGYDANKVIPIVSTDGSEFGDNLLKNKQILGTALQDPALMAKYVYTVLDNLIAGKNALDGTDYEWDNTVNSSGDLGDPAKEHIVKDQIIRMPYTEYEYKQ